MMRLLKPLRSSLRCLRLRPFDLGTAHGRADERHRRVALSAAAAALSKVIGLFATLVSIPLALGYLGAERFGIWSTLSSLVITLQFADLGIGNGVINTVADANGRGDRGAVRRYFCSGLMVAAVIAMILLLSTPVLTASVPWTQVFKLADPLAQQEIESSMQVFMVCIALAIPLGMVQRVQIGLQLGFIASLWQCLANLFSLLAIWLATYLQLGLPWLVLALLGAPLLTAVANGLLFFWRNARDLRPSFAFISRVTALRVLSTGGEFLVLQVAVAAVLYADSIVIAYVLGAAQVAEYAIPEKLFSIVSILLATALSPLWPAYREAIARKDLAWVTGTLKRSIALAFGLSLFASTLLVVGGPWVIHLWVGGAVPVNMSLLLTLGIWKILESVGLAFAMFLNGAGVIRLQVLLACVMLGATVLLKPYLVRDMGLIGAPLSTALIYGCITLLPLAFMIRGVVRDIKRRNSAEISKSALLAVQDLSRGTT